MALQTSFEHIFKSVLQKQILPMIVLSLVFWQQGWFIFIVK